MSNSLDCLLIGNRKSEQLHRQAAIKMYSIQYAQWIKENNHIVSDETFGLFLEESAKKMFEEIKK